MDKPQETAYLVSFTEGIFQGKLHFLCSAFLYFRQGIDALKGISRSQES